MQKKDQPLFLFSITVSACTNPNESLNAVDSCWICWCLYDWQQHRNATLVHEYFCNETKKKQLRENKMQVTRKKLQTTTNKETRCSLWVPHIPWFLLLSRVSSNKNVATRRKMMIVLCSLFIHHHRRLSSSLSLCFSLHCHPRNACLYSLTVTYLNKPTEPHFSLTVVTAGQALSWALQIHVDFFLLCFNMTKADMRQDYKQERIVTVAQSTMACNDMTGHESETKQQLVLPLGPLTSFVAASAHSVFSSSSFDVVNKREITEIPPSFLIWSWLAPEQHRKHFFAPVNNVFWYVC